MAEPSVLLVDEDPRRRRALEVGLRRSGFRVTVAGSAEQALWFLDHALPQVIVCASRFAQGMTSLSLAELIRVREDWSSIVLIMIRDPDGNREALALADDVVRERVTIATLAVRTRQALFQRRVDRLSTAEEGESRRLEGSFEEISPIDLLRLIERLEASGTLGVETPSGPATLWFSDGRVIDGALGRFEGEEAVFRLLMVDEGWFEMSLATCLHAEVIATSMENLISDSLRQLDEWIRLCCEVPPLDSCLGVDAALLESRRDELAEELFALIRSCDGRQTIREVVDGSELGPLLALEAIQNLRGIGVLVESSAEAEGERGDAWAELGPRELPPLPAFPEPFPGLGAELGTEHDTPLVSGIPEEISEEEEGDSQKEAKPSAEGAGGKIRSLAGRAVAADEYVFRPPRQEAELEGAEPEGGFGSPSSSAIERAIDDAISGLETRSEGARAGQALPVRGAANGRPSETQSASVAPGEDEGSWEASVEVPRASREKERAGDSVPPERAESEGRAPAEKLGEGSINRLGRVVSLVQIREPLAEPAPQSTPDRESFTAVAGTAAGDYVVAQAEPSLVECEEAMALALRTPSIVVNLAEIEDTATQDGVGVGSSDESKPERGTAAAESPASQALQVEPAAVEGATALVEGVADGEEAEFGEIDAAGAEVEEAEPRERDAEGAEAGECGQRDAAGAEEAESESSGATGAEAEEEQAEESDDVEGASISSAKRSFPATPVGVVAGEISDPGRAALPLVPESRGDLERLGELASQPLPSTSAAMWSAPPAGRSSMVLSASVSTSGAAHSGAAHSGAGHSGAGHSGAGHSMAARSMAARSMSGASAAHLFGANASAISRLEPTLGPYEDDEPELSRSSRGWLWVFVIGAASLGGWAWLSYGGAAEDGAAEEASEAQPAVDRRVIGPLSKTDVGDGGSSTGDSDGLDVPEPGGEEALSAEESASLAKQLEEGEKLYRQGSEKEASMLVAQILARAPKDGAALLLRAKICLDRGELAQALDAAKKAAQQRPDLAEAYLTIGVVHEEGAEIADAIAAYERYLELAPDARYASGIRRQVVSLRRQLP